ncbi:MAG: hypothetical protein HY286_14525 [Planctomycetes bacterium]|nr:hypothetical protein [Planctomycetota bacterium]
MPQRRYAFVSLQATGPDARHDHVFRLAARIPDGTGAAASIDWLANPLPDRDPSIREAVSSRLHRMYGVSAKDFEGRSAAATIFPEFRERLGDRAIITYDRESCLRWWLELERKCAGDGGDAHSDFNADFTIPTIVGVADLAQLVLPGRRSADRESFLQLAFAPGTGPRGDPSPSEIEQLLGALCCAFLSKNDEELTLASSGLAHVIQQLRGTDPAAAATFETCVDLLDRPSAWRTRDAGLFPAAAELVDGILSAHAGEAVEAIIAFASAKPRIAADLEALLLNDPVDDATTAPVELTETDKAILDLTFEELLPREIAQLTRTSDPRAFYRKHQHELARRILDALAGSGCLLIDAPTGTGKTMAYLIPALLWTLRARTRIGISTFTIALQEQVFDRELPRALGILRRAGAITNQNPVRVSLLKGRERYLCLRALESAAPSPDDTAEDWLAWIVLALFALDDPDGDLDRIARKLPFWMEQKRAGEAALGRLINEVHSRYTCCESAADRKRCGARVSRRRAERSHVVVTNHAFALRDPLFLRNIIFDECDHLHSQARGAASVELSFKSMRDDLESIAGPTQHAQRDGRHAGRGLLPKIEKIVSQRSILAAQPAGASLQAARAAADRMLAALARLERLGSEYLEYSGKKRAEGGFENHLGFQQFAAEQTSTDALKQARGDLVLHISELSGICKELCAVVDASGDPQAPRVRARLMLAAVDLAEYALDLQTWLPIVENEIKFDPNCFYDLELETGRGRQSLVARETILLPNRWLADRYYPSLQSMIFLSASTFLQDGFDLTRGYLGLELLEAGTPERAPRAVATHQSPQTFDYSRILLAIPDDVPETSFGTAGGRAAFDRYLEQFLRHLAERTRGRMLVLLTNLQQCRALGRALEPYFNDRCIPFFWQGMEGRMKEELPRLFRSSDGGVLMGVDTFWYGVDFPGDLLEYLVIAKLPFGALDRYTQAQEASLGKPIYQKTIYLPEALAMFRQGFGRLMRRETDRGAVFLLDPRVLSRWRRFLKELPGTAAETHEPERLQQFSGPTEECVRRALAHCGRLDECKRLGLGLKFSAGKTD